MGQGTGDGVIDAPAPNGDSYASPATVTASVDWSNPNATIVAGDIMPSGDTYAGAPITVAQAQTTPGLLTAGIPASTTTMSPATLALIVGGMLFAVVLIGKKG